MSKHIIKAAFKIKITCYQLVLHASNIFSCVALLHPHVVMQLSYIITWFRLLSCYFCWTQKCLYEKGMLKNFLELITC